MCVFVCVCKCLCCSFSVSKKVFRNSKVNTANKTKSTLAFRMCGVLRCGVNVKVHFIVALKCSVLCSYVYVVNFNECERVMRSGTLCDLVERESKK